MQATLFHLLCECVSLNSQLHFSARNDKMLLVLIILSVC